MSEVFKFSNKIDDGNDGEKNSESELTSVPFNANVVSKLESFANIREVGQLKKHLGRIEEIYIGLANSWKDSEENHEHVIIYLEEQLKTAKSNLADYQVTATEEVNAVKEQMKVLQEKMSKQHQEDIDELAKLGKVKDAAEKALSEAKETITEVNTNLALQKKRFDQTVNELNKRNKELSAASQEISFLKIQLEAEKDILKSTVKNHDQVLRYLKEQLSNAEGNMSYASMSDEETLEAGVEQGAEFKEPIAQQDNVLDLTSFTTAAAAETSDTDKLNGELSAASQEKDVPYTQLANENVILTSALPENKGGDFKQSPILTAQKTREQLKLRLQGLQAVNELDKRNTELSSPSLEISNLKVQAEPEQDTGKAAAESTDQKAADEWNSSVALKERSERDKLNKNISAASQKIDVFW